MPSRLTDSQVTALRNASLPPIPVSKYINGDGSVVFDSKSEAVLAILMEKYIRGWKVVLGETYQIPLVASCRADFKVGNIIIEYHPIDLHRESRRRPEIRDFKREIEEETTGSVRYRLIGHLEDIVAEAYAHERATLVRATFGEHHHMLHLRGPLDVWRKLFKICCPTRRSPTKAAFMKEWDLTYKNL